jgi:hypothetical protein
MTKESFLKEVDLVFSCHEGPCLSLGRRVHTQVGGIAHAQVGLTGVSCSQGLG